MSPEEFAATLGLTVRTEYEPATTDGRHARKFFEFAYEGRVLSRLHGRAEAEAWLKGYRTGVLETVSAEL